VLEAVVQTPVLILNGAEIERMMIVAVHAVVVEEVDRR